MIVKAHQLQISFRTRPKRGLLAVDPGPAGMHLYKAGQLKHLSFRKPDPLKACLHQEPMNRVTHEHVARAVFVFRGMRATVQPTVAYFEMSPSCAACSTGGPRSSTPRRSSVSPSVPGSPEQLAGSQTSRKMELSQAPTH